MNENKFLKNLNQKSGEPTPARSATSGSISSPAASESDPITRLSYELSRQSQVIEELSSLVKAMQQRQQKQPPAATYEQVKGLVDQSRPIHLDAESFAEHVGPSLVAVLPTDAGIQSALESGAAQLEQLGDQAVNKLRQATDRIPSRIVVEGTVLGFSSWQSLSLILGLFGVLLFGLGWYARHQSDSAQQWEQQANRSSEQLVNYKHFVGWLEAQKAYKQAVIEYNQQQNDGEKKP